MGRKVQIRKLPFEEWNALVAAWNELPRDERQEKHDACLKDGHDWALAPFGHLCCVKCVSYIHAEDQ